MATTKKLLNLHYFSFALEPFLQLFFFFCQVRSPFSSWDDRPRSPHPTPTLLSFTLSLPPPPPKAAAAAESTEGKSSLGLLSLSLSLPPRKKSRKKVSSLPRRPQRGSLDPHTLKSRFFYILGSNTTKRFLFPSGPTCAHAVQSR